MELIDRKYLMDNIAQTIEDSAQCFHEGEIMDCIKYAAAVDVDALRKRIDGGWVSVEKRLPSDDTEVFVLTRSKNGGRNVDKGYLTGGRWVHRGAAEVTHWMNIPKLPEE